MIKYLAVIYAWIGEKDLAIEQLAIAARIPGFLSYGELRLHPRWDPLRGDPRFDKVVASLAPNNICGEHADRMFVSTPCRNNLVTKAPKITKH